MTTLSSKIQVLDTLTASQIAAGEVVERPMSVVKELVENAIDAGAKHITVKIAAGGLTSIQVIDDGCGMEAVDLERAFLRHATSKIHSAADILGIATLGFRGEAMPSIASVSHVTIKSRTDNSQIGNQVTVTGEQVVSLGECGMPRGTIVTVEDLFFNTPVRKKFLKKSSVEGGQVSDLIARFILARPDIAFVFQEDGRTSLHSPGTGSLEQSVMAIYNRDVLGNMLCLPANDLLTGMISSPSLQRANRSYYHFFINGRWVNCKELGQAVDTAYATLLPQRRYPIVVLYLQLPAGAVDVNVHPAKLEVRFRDWPSLRQQVLGILMATLLGKNSQTSPSSLVKPLPTYAEEVQPVAIQERMTPFFTGQGLDSLLYQTSLGRSNTLLQAEQTAGVENPLAGQQSENILPNTSWQTTSLSVSCPQTDAVSLQKLQSVPESAGDLPPAASAELATQAVSTPGFPWLSLKIMGQLQAMYLLAEGADGLYLIDQHAAHERLRYEKYKRDFFAKQGKATQLTLPVALPLSHKQKNTLVRLIEEITAMGFLVEYFGDNDFLLRGVPAWYEEGNGEGLLLAILDTIGDDEVFDSAVFCEDRLFHLACHSAVRANDHLNSGDMNWLLKELDQANCPFTCPHGRPIAVRITFEELNRRFYRS